MNSIILCEGSSDFVLLQYYMRTVYGLSLIHISEPTRRVLISRMPSSA